MDTTTMNTVTQATNATENPSVKNGFIGKVGENLPEALLATAILAAGFGLGKVTEKKKPFKKAAEAIKGFGDKVKSKTEKAVVDIPDEDVEVEELDE